MSIIKSIENAVEAMKKHDAKPEEFAVDMTMQQYTRLLREVEMTRSDEEAEEIEKSRTFLGVKLNVLAVTQ